jgi:hypothetical protein
MDTPLNAALRGTRGGPEEYDGVAEIWFDEASLPATPEAAVAGQALLDDEKKFIDLARSPLWLGEERPIL